ncbi:hypothetical protein [Nonomuraea aridisoli]|uniref:Uncharacterized protein n=1 Tax=Nonomuraea aridisoli TaxID=2070368 RepID=A0A2W2D8H5_9ACTN|nr:hypothetical protein [Nonomuraea aridisoli]PZG07173.1 hypothetical protein C1J01_41270 [Nonomuraea aridisoli]
MPKLKSVIAGLALSTAMAGGTLVAGAATTTASAAATTTQFSTGTSILAGHGCFRGRRCGWGRRHHHHERRHLRIIIENFNHNRNPKRHLEEHRRHDHRRWDPSLFANRVTEPVEGDVVTD